MTNDRSLPLSKRGGTEPGERERAEGEGEGASNGKLTLQYSNVRVIRDVIPIP